MSEKKTIIPFPYIKKYMISSDPDAEITNKSKAVTPYGLNKFISGKNFSTGGSSSGGNTGTDTSDPSDPSTSEESKSDTGQAAQKYDTTVLDIGVPGEQGYGVGVPACSEKELKVLFLSPMEGTYDKTSDNYGNFTHSNGGTYVFIPHFFVRYGSDDSDVYLTYGINSIDIKNHWAFETEEDANKAGWFTPRAFYDGSATEWKQGFFIAKYCVSKVSLNSDNYPQSTGNDPWVNELPATMMAQTKLLGDDYFVGSIFCSAALRMILFAAAQHSTGTAYCAWYKGLGQYNMPDGWDSTNPAMYSHNGQKNGIMQISHYRWNMTLGIVGHGGFINQTAYQSSHNKAHILNSTIRMKDLQSTFGNADSVWGSVTTLVQNETYYLYTVPFTFPATTKYTYWNMSKQMWPQPVTDGVLDSTKRDVFMILPDTASSFSTSKSTIMGNCECRWTSYSNTTMHVFGQSLDTDGANQNIFSNLYVDGTQTKTTARSWRPVCYLRDK